MDPQVLTRPEAKRAFVRRMFDGIAGTYDLLNHVLSAGADMVWRRRTIDWLRPVAGWRILDLATGTGDLGFEAGRRHPGISVTGLDISLPMLRLGRAKARKLSRRMAFLCGDAEHLPFPDGTFRAAVAAFGIRNLAEVDAGLGEIRRALCPGGRVAILEFSCPRSLLARGLYLLYFRHVLPGVGRIVSRHPDAYRYLFESVVHFGRGADLVERLTGAGFVGAVGYPLTGGIATLYVGSRPPTDDT